MQDIIANEEHIRFDFEPFVKEQLGLSIGENARKREVCKYFLKGHCPNGSKCLYRHNKGERSVVCKHWIRSLCKKGDSCEFLHEMNRNKMPECYFYTQYKQCTNPECYYLHVDPDAKRKICVWYSKGFCKHGPSCRGKHVRKVICPLYLTGFCPSGPDCENEQ
ncbi:hypothetical protein ROZALSC1DRAFT_15790 [Rozella allomycis CSF55]|uniref:mRNA 3'-end-processing protein n=1 Tax=Rozella allomycis (strain CSF55) TaxID=988480 RepID=A0A4P9YGX5_ROZAC|nr:hypothetical protein ROZALSC1DRAFT_15790 [Rozella allomycis CSF55]